ncbi:MAG: GNAT family N-acetyltransferase [Candidatus Flexifilum sp.]
MIPHALDPAHVHVTVTNTQEKHIEALARLQRLVFPTLDDSELFTEAKYRKHLELFPEGQFVAILHTEGRDIVIGATSTFRTNFDFEHTQHRFIEAIAHGWLTNHDPNGEWLYGADVSVHPNYRGLRIGRRLYDARHRLVRQLNLRGEIAGALMPNYVHNTHLTIAQYVLHVWQGKIHDPTLSMQIRNGFKPRGILYDHISDPRSNNAAALIVRENPHYRPVAVATTGD